LVNISIKGYFPEKLKIKKIQVKILKERTNNFKCISGYIPFIYFFFHLCSKFFILYFLGKLEKEVQVKILKERTNN